MARYPDIERTLARTHTVLRTREYSRRTERAYLGWIRRFLRFHDARRAEHMGREEVEAFLEHLATCRRLGAKSRNQAASALAFLYREILGRDVVRDVARARGSRKVPTVLTHHEAVRVIDALRGVHRIVAGHLYGSGLPPLPQDIPCRILAAGGAVSLDGARTPRGDYAATRGGRFWRFDRRRPQSRGELSPSTARGLEFVFGKRGRTLRVLSLGKVSES